MARFLFLSFLFFLKERKLKYGQIDDVYGGGLGILYFRGRKKQTNSNFGFKGNTLSKRKVGVVAPRKATTFRQLKVKFILQRRDKVWSFCWHVSYHKFFPQLPQLSR